MKSIISFDLDMTLLNHRTFEIPKSALKTLEALRGRHLIVLATGRDMDNYYSRQFKELIRPDAVIHNNGTKVTVGERVVYESQMPGELLRRIVDFAEKENLAVGVTLGDGDYYTHPELVAELDKKRWGQSGRQFRNPRELLGKGVRTLAYVGPPSGAARLEQAFKEIKCPLFAGLQGADILEKKNSKAHGLKLLCDFYGIDIAATYAFGDSMNDYEIIKAAGTGIAMGNAIEELKAAADYVTADIGEDGIYKACRHFGLI